jgi:hypothetical protein
MLSYDLKSLEELLDLFVPTEHQEFCGGQFIVCECGIFCFFSLSGANQVKLESPSLIRWNTEDAMEGDQSNEDSFLNKILGKGYDHAIQIFLSPDASSYIHVGRAHLSSYGWTDHFRGEVCFTLHEKLSRALWVSLGGTAGWQICVNDDEHLLPFDSDFSSLLHILLTLPNIDLWTDCWEGDCLMMWAGRDSAFLSYTHSTGERLVTRNRAYMGAPGQLATFLCSGKSIVVPFEFVISKDAAIKAVGHYLRYRKLSKRVHWVED